MSKIGIVKHWNEERGFGHIGQEGNPQDIFVHRTCLIGATALKLNDRVVYDAIYDDRKKKFQAISVRALAPHEMPGQQFAPAPGMGGFPQHPMHPNPYQQPMPVHGFQSSPSQMTPMSSPGTPPMQSFQNFVQQQHSQRFTFQRQGTANSLMGGSPGNGMFMQHNPAGPPMMSPNQNYM
jgi:cold shock CspA family protein